MKQYPTIWQKKVLWGTLVIVAIAVLIWLLYKSVLILQFVGGTLQALLLPVVIAVILSYLLDPLVKKITKFGVRRLWSVVIVSAAIVAILVGIGFWVFPSLYDQSNELAKNVPAYFQKTQDQMRHLAEKYQHKWAQIPYMDAVGKAWLDYSKSLPATIGTGLKKAIGGSFSLIGTILSFLLVPVYLFFFLSNANSISKHWSEYVPLRASPFKDEVVDCLSEINRYLIAYFRGQICVTLIDGALIGISLFCIGLKFALLIGLMVAILQMIPYAGIVVCWIPAVLISIGQSHSWWFPLLVTIIFIVVSNLDSLFIAPFIVGESVGLHPVTIIISVIGWGIVFGGLLGAFLAVPLTATLKVLLRRYVWEDRSPAPKRRGVVTAK